MAESFATKTLTAHGRQMSLWKEIASSFLKVGATAYGGPAIMGVMQVEFQGKRQWLTKPRFLEGLELVNVLPGATATQLGIYLGRGWGRPNGGAFANGTLVILDTH